LQGAAGEVLPQVLEAAFSA